MGRIYIPDQVKLIDKPEGLLPNITSVGASLLSLYYLSISIYKEDRSTQLPSALSGAITFKTTLVVLFHLGDKTKVEVPSQQ